MEKTVCSVINVLMKMKCKRCSSEKLVKNGKNRSGIQRYLCNGCGHTIQENYSYSSCSVTDQQLIMLTKESCGIRSISRILAVSPSTVIRRIKKIGSQLVRPCPILKGKIYEVDELFTYVQTKDNRICIAYSYEPQTGFVIDISVGRRVAYQISRYKYNHLLISNLNCLKAKIGRKKLFFQV